MSPLRTTNAPDLDSARSMVASLVRFETFEITVGLRDAAGERVVRGTPAVVHGVLAGLDRAAQVTRFDSALAPSRTSASCARRRGWWG